VKFTLPGPVIPDVVSVKKELVVVALHAHVAAVDTRMLLAPPANATFIVACGIVSAQVDVELGVVGDSERLHAADATAHTSTATPRAVQIGCIGSRVTRVRRIRSGF
jgi:hypothetical protein